MGELSIITSLETLGRDYDALLCDAWGVIHDGVNLFPGAEEALMRFRENRGAVIILTNAPRPSVIIPPQLDRLGLSRDAYDAVVTSGDATRAAIEVKLPAPAYKLGPPKDDPLFEGLAIDFRPLVEAAFIICTGMMDEFTQSPEDYRELLVAARARDLPMVCANPDIVVNWGGKIIWCAGALAEIYEQLGGEVIYGGKPHKPIYELALKAINAQQGETPRKRILAIGDGLNTDIKGANNQGIDVLMVAGDGGIHKGARDGAALAAQLDAAGLHAIAAAEALRW